MSADELLNRELGKDYSLSPKDRNVIIECMKEYAQQAIDRCAESADIYADVGGYVFVDTQSILRVKEELK